MPSEPPAKATRSSKKDKPDAPAKASKAVKSTEVTDPPPMEQELELPTETKTEVQVDADSFQVAFYMKHFRVSDIIVKVVDHTLIIDACHREHADEHGLVSRSMIRKHKLPTDIKLETLTSAFTGNGFLVVHAERVVVKDQQN